MWPFKKKKKDKVEYRIFCLRDDSYIPQVKRINDGGWKGLSLKEPGIVDTHFSPWSQRYNCKVSTQTEAMEVLKVYEEDQDMLK